MMPRSKSVEKHRIHSTQKINVETAADQIIENSMNQFMVEVQREEHMKAIKEAEKDVLDSMYDNPGGKVFDLNNDLNGRPVGIASQMIRFDL